MKALDFDWKPLLLAPILALVALPLTGSFSTWLTLTVAGLAMGMIIFIIASGLTLVFGLMDVLNFGHGVFIALGAFVASSVLGLMGDWTGSGELWRNLVAVFPAMLVAMAVAATSRPSHRRNRNAWRCRCGKARSAPSSASAACDPASRSSGPGSAASGAWTIGSSSSSSGLRRNAPIQRLRTCRRRYQSLIRLSSTR